MDRQHRRSLLATTVSFLSVGCLSSADTRGRHPETGSPTASTDSPHPPKSVQDTVSDRPVATDRDSVSLAMEASVLRPVGTAAPGRISISFRNLGDRPVAVRFGRSPPFTALRSARVDGRQLVLVPEETDPSALNQPADEIIPDQPTNDPDNELPCWKAAPFLVVELFLDCRVLPGESVSQTYTVLWKSDSECGPGTYRFERTTNDEGASLPLRLSASVTVAPDGSLSTTADVTVRPLGETATK